MEIRTRSADRHASMLTTALPRTQRRAEGGVVMALGIDWISV